MVQIIIISFLAVLIALLGLMLALQITNYFTKCPVSIRTLFIGLKPKLWMTAGLGLFFSCFYIAVVFLASWLLEGDIRQRLFKLAYHYPAYFIYGGLALFISISLGILVVRHVIKRTYNSKGPK